MSEENKKRLTRQRLLMYGAGAAAVAAASVWIFSGDGTDNQSRAEDLRRRKAMTDVINPPGMADDFLSETGTRLAAVEGAISRLEADNTSLKEALRTRDLELAATRADLQKTRDDAAAMVEDMAGRVASVSGTCRRPNPLRSAIPSGGGASCLRARRPNP